MARARELFLSSSGLGQRGVGHIEVSDMDVLDSEVSDIGVLESEVGHAALLAAQPERKECGALVSDTQVSDIEVLDNVSNSEVSDMLLFSRGTPNGALGWWFPAYVEVLRHLCSENW